MKLEAIAIKEKDKDFRVVNGKMFRDECNKLSPGRYRMTIERMRKNKSNPQLGYYYACVLPLFMRHLIDAGYEFTNIDQVDAFAKARFASQQVINKHTGEVIEIPGLKREMTTLEMSTFTNAIRDWDAEYLGGYIPEPESQIQMQYQ
jgi:hypothetical protein